jgi:hypothetical protein
MSTPSGRAAAGASLLGHEYQHVIAWAYAARAAHPTTAAEEFQVESRDAASYDDVVVSEAGGGTYVQAKFVMDAPGGFSLDWLLSPQGASNESMAQKALASFRTLRARGPVRMHLYTNRELDPADAFGALRGERLTVGHAAARVIRGERLDPEGTQALTRLREHLGCDVDELLALLDVWELRWGTSLPMAEDLAAAEMRGLGLRDDTDAITRGRNFIQSLVTSGIRSLQVTELRERVRGLNLQAGRAVRVLSVAAIGPEPSAQNAHVVVDLRTAFAGRADEAARGLDDWASADNLLSAGVDELGPPRALPVLVNAAARLPVWFRIGTLLRGTRGWTIGCDFQDQLVFSDTRPSGSLLTPPQELGAGSQLVVPLSVTWDVRESVERRITTLEITGTRLLPLSVRDTGTHALDSPAAVTAVVEDVKRTLLSSLDRQPAEHVHLFMAAPKSVALLLGHHWHGLAPVTVYEELVRGRGYQPAFTIAD